MMMSLKSYSMKSNCTTRRVTAYYSYHILRVACKAPAFVVADTEGAGAIPKNLNEGRSQMIILKTEMTVSSLFCE